MREATDLKQNSMQGSPAHMPKIRIALRVLGLALVVFLACVAFLPHHGRPDVSVNLLGYTNDSSGERLARIAVTNLSDFPIMIYLPTIQIQSPAEPNGFTNYFQGNTNQWHRFHSKIGGSKSGNFTIPPPPPTYQSPWRLSFLVYTDVDFEAARIVRRLVEGRRMPFSIEGDWFEAEK